MVGTEPRVAGHTLGVIDEFFCLEWEGGSWEEVGHRWELGVPVD